MGLDEPSVDHSSFTRNRARLLEHDVARELVARIVEQARAPGLMSDEHFTVDGTLIEAWPSQGSQPPAAATVNFHGKRRSNPTHESTTDPKRVWRARARDKEAKLCYSGNGEPEQTAGRL